MEREITLNHRNYEVTRLFTLDPDGETYLVKIGDQPGLLRRIRKTPGGEEAFDERISVEMQGVVRLPRLGIRTPYLLDADPERGLFLKSLPSFEQLYDPLSLRHEIDGRYIVQMRDMCRLLYDDNINIDYNPVNFLVRVGVLFYNGYFYKPYKPDENFAAVGKKLWSDTPEFRAFSEDYDRRFRQFSCRTRGYAYDGI